MIGRACEAAARGESVARHLHRGTFGVGGLMLEAEISAAARRHGVRLDDELVTELVELMVHRSSMETLPLEPGTATARAPAPTSTERYEDLGPLGEGGMGEVRRVRDRALNRTLAMKIARRGGAGHTARFVEEAQATAQLQHPGIVAVHELGTLPDGRSYFTMKEVRGRTLRAVIAEVHAGQPMQGWTFRRLVTAVHQATQAVAYAHERGVVHRDLKPENIMLGDFGEVQVVDWGLAKVRGRPDLAGAEGALDVVVTDRSLDDAASTRVGTVAGTPAYMAPEQARGDVDAIDERTDVYALGCVLYEVISGRPPYAGSSGHSVWQQVLRGPPRPPKPLEAADAPRALVQLCVRAMARAPEDRFQGAGALASELEAWLDGSRRREEALAIVARAQATVPRAAEQRARAEDLRAQAEALGAGVPTWAPERAKAPAWALEDEALRQEEAAGLCDLERAQLLAGALTHAPTLPEAHAALVSDYLGQHAAAEAAHDPSALARAEALVRAHAEALPERHPLRATSATWLRGDGSLTLVTDPPGAEVRLLRYERRHRRLVAVESGSLGRTPLQSVSLEMGSYLCELDHPERAPTRYPVHIARSAHWDGVPPGGTLPRPISLLERGALGSDEVYVPAGWFLAGDSAARGSIAAGTRLWCDAFAIQRFAVTNRAYLAFLADLLLQGLEHEAMRWAPQEPSGRHGRPGAVIYGREPGGGFVLAPDSEGDTWLPDWPVVMVDWHAAEAYARWYAERTGLPWRLAWDFEREKAARGVDGRIYPWGDGTDGSYACTRDSHAGRALLQVVDTFPLDCSPYGVRGVGGNNRDWCADVWTKDGALPDDRVVRPWLPPDPAENVRRVTRGGTWFGVASGSRCAARDADDAMSRYAHVGIRLARSLPDTRCPREA